MKLLLKQEQSLGQISCVRVSDSQISSMAAVAEGWESRSNDEEDRCGRVRCLESEKIAY